MNVLVPPGDYEGRSEDKPRVLQNCCSTSLLFSFHREISLVWGFCLNSLWRKESVKRRPNL